MWLLFIVVHQIDVDERLIVCLTSHFGVTLRCWSRRFNCFTASLHQAMRRSIIYVSLYVAPWFAVIGAFRSSLFRLEVVPSVGWLGVVTCDHLTQRATKARRGSVHVSTLNPKCVTVGELYGEVNTTTMEWKDGLLSHIYRKYAKNSRGPIQCTRRKQSNTSAPNTPRLSRNSSAKSVVTSVSAMSVEDNSEGESLRVWVSKVFPI